MEALAASACLAKDCVVLDATPLAKAAPPAARASARNCLRVFNIPCNPE
jgi:hypothetical protein